MQPWVQTNSKQVECYIMQRTITDSADTHPLVRNTSY